MREPLDELQSAIEALHVYGKDKDWDFIKRTEVLRLVAALRAATPTESDAALRRDAVMHVLNDSGAYSRMEDVADAILAALRGTTDRAEPGLDVERLASALYRTESIPHLGRDLGVVARSIAAEYAALGDAP